MGLVSLLKKKNRTTLFTTPSHGRKFFIFHKFYQWYKYDISETDTHDPQEALKQAEHKASKIYGTRYTKFLTNGSTSGVIAAIISSGVKKILIWDKAHPCHRNGAILAGCQITEYTLPINEKWGADIAITPAKVKELLNKYPADGIIITTPTYEGFAANIKEISLICKKKNVKLIADEAHGALYPFSDELPESAVKYADYTIQSLHKTAGGLNPTALLHSNDNDPEEALSMINTTSPSYPLLATIEANINFLNSKKGRRKLDNLIKFIKSLKLPQGGEDITKILIKKEGLTGYQLSEILFDKYKIEDEKTNEVSTMLLCGIGTSKRMLIKLKKALEEIYSEK